MKKIFSFMTVVFAAMILLMGCKSEDDKISAQEFAKLLTSTAWAGTHLAQHNNGSWSSSAPQNVVIRFDRATNTANSGTGMQIEFSDASLDESKFERMSTITWQLVGEEMTIIYDAGWDKAYMKYTDNECHINENAFSGIFYTSYSHRFLFNYGRSNFNEWDKYRNRR